MDEGWFDGFNFPRRCPQGGGSDLRISRRSFLKAGIATGTAVSFPWSLHWPNALASTPGGSLDPSGITKYQMPLVIPPAMPRTSAPGGKNVDY